MGLPPGMKVTYVDRPDLNETFTDSLESFTFNNNLMRIDFCITRTQIVGEKLPMIAKKYPVCRTVMPLDAAVELFNKLNHFFAALEKTGAIKRESATGSITPPDVTKH